MKDKPVILAVDDQLQNLELLEAHLEPQGYEVVTAISGEEALANVIRYPPDLILLDIMMQGMSGFEVLQKLRANEDTRLIPVVMVTALRETEDRVKALDAGCDDFISKPFEKVELLARIKSLLKISYYRRQLDEKEKFEAVLNDINDAIVVCDAGGKVEQVNASAKRYFNGIAPSADLISLLYDQYTASITKEELTSKAKHRVFELMRKGTEKFKALYLQASLDRVTGPEGKVSSVVFVFRDFTEEKMEQEMKQDFMGLISHKLKTPVTVLMSGLSLIQDGVIGELNDKQKGYIDNMAAQSRDLNRLIDKLIGFVTIERGKLDLPDEDVILKIQLENFAKVISMIDYGKKVDFNIDVAGEATTAKINGVYFDLIVGNLIENAIKFNDKNAVKIDIKAETQDGRVKLSVTDNGCGIPPEERERIFEKFYQIERSFTGNVEGVGLGLALVKRIVEVYGGDVELISEIGKGSTFSCTLPA